MAEFGPKVFHALSHCVEVQQVLGVTPSRDRIRFAKVDPTEVGLEEKGAGRAPSSAEDIESFKNALFKLFMLRARNELAALPEDQRQDARDKGIDVTVTLNLSNSLIHQIPQGEPGVNRVVVRPSGLDTMTISPAAGGNPIENEDIKNVIGLIERSQAMACGSNNNFRKVFNGDDFFAELWDLDSTTT